jgi:hypothetical protein
MSQPAGEVPLRAGWRVAPTWRPDQPVGWLKIWDGGSSAAAGATAPKPGALYFLQVSSYVMIRTEAVTEIPVRVC